MEALAKIVHGIDPTLTTGLAAPVVVFFVWVFLQRIRRHLIRDHGPE
jgi:uncharacterized membrane-anchored protein